MDVNASEAGSEHHSTSSSQVRRLSEKTDRASVSSPLPHHRVNGEEEVQVDSPVNGTKAEHTEGHAESTPEDGALHAAGDPNGKERLTL